MTVWIVSRVDLLDDGRSVIVEVFGAFSSEELARTEALSHEGDVFVGPMALDESIPETIDWPGAYFVGWSA